jgi:hypothetical protein
MGASWVAGTVRARLLSRRRLGRAGARDLALEPTLTRALQRLAESPYAHDVEGSMSLLEAQRAVQATALWHLRVLAGWLPPGGAEMVRAFAGRWEIENIEDRLRSFRGVGVSAPFELGSLATAWSRVASSTGAEHVREILSASPWGDPGGTDPAEVVLSLKLSWARRIAESAPGAADLAAGWSALLAARSLFVSGRPAASLRPRPVELGVGWANARSLGEMGERLPGGARWVLEDVGEPEDLWRAEARWWNRLGSDGLRFVSSPGRDPRIVVGAAAALTADAWRTAAALEIAARGGRGIEVFDAVG